MDWQPDFRSEVPLYRQIVQFIKEKIATGQWPVGSRLPSHRYLSQLWQLDRSTIATAMAELAADGLVEGHAGKGTLIINNTWSLVASMPAPDWQSYVDAGVQHPNLPTVQSINSLEFSPLLRLGTGELSPSLFPVQEMGEIMRDLSAAIPSLGYEEAKGFLPLRRQLAARLQAKGIDVSPASIMIVSGALQALYLIAQGILHRGATVYVEKPSYLFSLRIFQSAGMHLQGLPTDSDGIRPSGLPTQDLATPSLLYTIPTFHNPTGMVMPLHRRQELLRHCQQYQLPIIEDDVYGELWLDGPPPPPLKALDPSGLVLYLSSLSKSLSPGLRIGWLAGPEPIISRLADIKMQMDYGASSLSQWVAAHWLAEGRYDRYLTNLRTALRQRRQTMLEALTEHFSDLASWQTPPGGFYVWLTMNRPISPHQLFQHAVQEGILLNPGNLYDREADRHLRLSYAYAPEEELSRGIASLARIVRQLWNS